MTETLRLFAPDYCPESLTELAMAITEFLDSKGTAVYGHSPGVFRKYFIAPPRHFFRLCQSAIQRGLEHKQPWDDWMTPNNPFRELLTRIGRETEFWPCLQAHLLCVRAAIEPDFWPETGRVSEDALKKIAYETKLSRGFLDVLAAELCGRPLPVERELTMPVLLVQERGILADLTLKLIAPGCGDCYAAPMVSLIYVHADFRAGLVEAQKYVTERLGWKLGQRDICWDLRPREGEWPAELKGPSASAATALLLAKLLAMSDSMAMRR